MNWNYYTTDKNIIFENAHSVEHEHASIDIKDDNIKLLLINELLKQHTNLAPVDFLNHDTYGKPFLCNTDKFHINFSHSSDVCVSVLSTSPCGIDIQKIKPYNPNVAQKYFTPGQIEILSTANKQDQDRFYTEFWTQFEAICKCDGRGIARAFPDIDLLREKIQTISYWDTTKSYCVTIAVEIQKYVSYNI